MVYVGCWRAQNPVRIIIAREFLETRASAPRSTWDGCTHAWSRNYAHQDQRHGPEDSAICERADSVTDFGIDVTGRRRSLWAVTFPTAPQPCQRDCAVME